MPCFKPTSICDMSYIQFLCRSVCMNRFVWNFVVYVWDSADIHINVFFMSKNTYNLNRKNNLQNPIRAISPTMEVHTTGPTTQRRSRMYKKHKITTPNTAPSRYHLDCTKSWTICADSWLYTQFYIRNTSTSTVFT